MDNLGPRLKTHLAKSLPGVAAQNQMKAHRVGGEDIFFEHKGPPRLGAVAILLYPQDGKWCIPLIKRKEYPGIHSGQISLPGGKLEPTDRDLVDTAVRESNEELGVTIVTDQVVGRLSELYIIASHFNILPVVVILEDQPVFVPDQREVDQVIVTSIDQLLTPDVKQEKDLLVRGYDIRAPYFDIADQVVWGATAMILNEFVMVLKEIKSA